MLGVLLLAACSQLETTKETHTVHVVDYGAELPDGVKLTDPRPATFVLYRDGALAGQGEQSFNGMLVLPPARYWNLLTNEAALAELAGLSADGRFASELDAESARAAAELGLTPAAARDVAFGRLVRAQLAAAAARLRPAK